MSSGNVFRVRLLDTRCVMQDTSGLQPGREVTKLDGGQQWRREGRWRGWDWRHREEKQLLVVWRKSKQGHCGGAVMIGREDGVVKESNPSPRHTPSTSIAREHYRAHQPDPPSHHGKGSITYIFPSSNVVGVRCTMILTGGWGVVVPSDPEERLG